MFITRPVVSRLFQQTGSLSAALTTGNMNAVPQSVRRYHDAHFKPPSMDELPVPRGSWQSQYDANQRRYNAVLLMGIAFCAGTIVVAKASGLVYLNYSPPKSLD